MEIGESFRVLSMKPSMVTSRADEQVGVAMVGPIAVDVMDVFAFLERTSQRLFRFLYVNCLGPRFTAGTVRHTLGAIDVSADTNAIVCLPFGLVAAFLTSSMRRQFECAAIGAWIQRLAEFISRQSYPFRSSIQSYASRLESRRYASFNQMSALLVGHCAGILRHGAGIA
jgi:hypothetical protein